MKMLALALVLVAVAATLVGAQYHDPKLLLGGYGTTSSLYQRGLFMMDAKNQTITSLFPSWVRNYSIYSAMMDADNKRIVFIASGTTSTAYNVKDGLFRYDPVNKVLTTLVVGNYGTVGPLSNMYRVMIDQDGDYVFGAQSRTPTNRYHSRILKYSVSSKPAVIFTSTMLNNPFTHAYFTGALGRDIDTGDILVNQGAGTSSTLSPLGYYAWLRIDPNVIGKWSTFSAGLYGTYYGRSQPYGLVQQDYRTGEIHESYAQQVYVQQPGYGRGGYTTLWNWGYPGGFSYRITGVHDLQSAPQLRYATTGYFYRTRTSPTTLTYYASALAYKYGAPTFGSQIIDCDPNNAQTQRYGATYASFCLDWWRGRNIQTVKIGTNQWQVRFSCPNYPGKTYLAMVCMSGIRPGVPLRSGRRIWINPDDLGALALQNKLLPFWSGGPGVLDSGGEAQGFLNTSLIAPLGGLPVWIAMVVLDFSSPDGIAFIPDTYVMKLP